jgi:predicted DsbA family dithiol-disulfide isomerase
MHDELFENQSKLKQGNFEIFAEKIGLDKEPFLKCMKSNRYDKDIDKDIADACIAQVTGTSTFVLGKTTDDVDVVDGARLVGAQPLTTFEAHLEKLLKQAEAKT